MRHSRAAQAHTLAESPLVRPRSPSVSTKGGSSSQSFKGGGAASQSFQKRATIREHGAKLDRPDVLSSVHHLARVQGQHGGDSRARNHSGEWATKWEALRMHPAASGSGPGVGVDETTLRAPQTTKTRACSFLERKNSCSVLSGALSRAMDGTACGKARTPSGSDFRPVEVSSVHETYKYDDELSLVHMQLRMQRTRRELTQLNVVSVAMVIAVGVALGLLSTLSIVASTSLHLGQATVLELVLATPTETELVGRSVAAGENALPLPSRLLGWLVYVGLNIVIISLAAVLSGIAPITAGSGIAHVKAYLNGTSVPAIFDLKTLVCKALGVCLIVSTSLPLGKEGPMVHIGAIVASQISCVTLPFAPALSDTMSELRFPQAQRIWVGMGTAAGVAAAFQAPIGGVLYAFEEVCSNWTAVLTWRAFACVVVVSFTMSSVTSVWPEAWASIFQVGGLSLGLEGDARRISSYSFSDMLWYALVGILGGAVGATYNALVIFFIKQRARLLPPLPPAAPAGKGARGRHSADSCATRARRCCFGWSRGARARVAEAACMAFLVFSLFFWVPFALPCSPCQPHMSCYMPPPPAPGNSSSGAAHGSWSGASASDARRALAEAHASAEHTGHSTRVHLVYLQYGCRAGEYSQAASLLHTGQEGLVMHLLERTGNAEVPLHELSLIMALYVTLAVLVFGISVPGGNFIPGMTIGAMLGRIMGELMRDAGLIAPTDVGMYALVGSAAVLSGITRMTLTIAVILIELSKDVGALIPIVVTVTAAKMAGSLLYVGFDDALISLRKVNFLEEAPPPEFENLLTVSVMSTPVVCVQEVDKVSNLLSVLATTQHNGFPVVSSCPGVPPKTFAGLILRRQLLVVLEGRVWEQQAKDDDIPASTRTRFVGSFFSRLSVDNLNLTKKDLQAVVDLRPFVDPSPYVVSDLMPMRRVYRLFNEIGVRHLPVITNQNVVGILTRKDVLPEAMHSRAKLEHLMSSAVHGVTEGLSSVTEGLAAMRHSVADHEAPMSKQLASMVSKGVRSVTRAAGKAKATGASAGASNTNSLSEKRGPGAAVAGAGAGVGGAGSSTSSQGCSSESGSWALGEHALLV